MKYRQNVALAKSLSCLPVQGNSMPNLMSLKCMTQRSVLFQFFSFLFPSTFPSSPSSCFVPPSSPSRRYGEYFHSVDALYRPNNSYVSTFESLYSRCLRGSVVAYRLRRNSRFCNFSSHIIVLSRAVKKYVRKHVVMYTGENLSLFLFYLMLVFYDTLLTYLLTYSMEQRPS